MERKDNYAIQVQQAKRCFLTYDQDALIRKMHLEADEQYLYIPMLSQRHRIRRDNGDMERLTKDGWVSADSHGEVMTLLDLICDSRENRFVTGRWRSMESFGLMFHQNLLQDKKDHWAERFDRDPEGFRNACENLGGTPIPGGDLSFAIPIFEKLCVGIQFWHGDEEFHPRLRYLWDENALMYLKYETMYYAVSLLLRRIGEEMD
jgi:hypothetical protein